MAKLIVIILLAAFNLILGTVILMGKCDNFILGCFGIPTAKDAEKFDIRRLRLLIGLFLIIISPLFFLLTIEGVKWPGHLFSAAIWFLLVTYYILVYTWARKKQ